VDFLVRKRKLPTIEIDYPRTEEEARNMVIRVKEFLEGLK